MLFNSVEFIFAFFPITVLVFFGIARFSHLLAAGWLTLTSLFFYGWWNPPYVVLLVASIAFNYVSGFHLARLVGDDRRDLARTLLAIAITANLALLGYYKYANFFLDIVSSVTGSELRFGRVVLPLGISFAPDRGTGPAPQGNEDPQFQQARTYRVHWEDVAVGPTIFFIGLFKKVVIADGVAPYASPLFASPGRLAAWGGTLAYTFQLYFDFSGYSDIAIDDYERAHPAELAKLSRLTAAAIPR